jgi:hypothetical protein
MGGGGMTAARAIIEITGEPPGPLRNRVRDWLVEANAALRAAVNVQNTVPDNLGALILRGHLKSRARNRNQSTKDIVNPPAHQARVSFPPV